MGTLIDENDVGIIPVGNGSPLYFSFDDVRAYPYYLTGEMDEVRIWEHARSEEEIRGTMNRRLTGSEPGLAGYWNYNEVLDDQNVYDFSPYGSHGTLGADLNPGGDDPIRRGVRG